MSKKAFGTTSKGVEASLYEISNGGELRVLLTDYGAAVVSICVKDRDGNERDVILGYDDVKSYEKEDCYFGATVGRYANRISDAKVNIDGVEYKLEANDNENSLHSGSNGFSKRFWTVKEQKADEITFEIEDADLEQGFPGNAVVDVTFKVTGENALAIIYNAKADKTTTFNMTNHSYFNLSGNFTQPINDHVFQINHQGLYPIHPDGVPLQTVDRESPVVQHLYQAMLLEDLFKDSDPQIRLVEGLDHPFALPEGHENAGFLYHQPSGRFLTFKSEAPALVVYSANFVDETVHLQGQPMVQHNGLALEFQTVPDAIHSDQAEKVILRGGQVFTSKTSYHAIAKK